MERREFLKRSMKKSLVVAGAAAGVFSGVSSGVAQGAKSRVRSGFGPWLAMMMNEKRASAARLAKKAKVDPQYIEDLCACTLDPEKDLEATKRITVAILGHEDPEKLFPDLLKTLRVHTDMRDFRASCDGGCCSWNLMID